MSKERASSSKAESSGSEENKLYSKGETNFLPKQIMLPSHAAGTSSSVGEEKTAAADTAVGTFQRSIYRAVCSSDWLKTQDLLAKYRDSSFTTIISSKYGTVLHVAVTTGNLQFVNRLLNFMTRDDIEKVINSWTPTPLSMAACYGFTEIAKVLVEKHKHSLEIPSEKGHFPVVAACANSHEDTTRYLYGVTRKEALIEGIQGATLINTAIDAEMFDIAIHLLRKCEQLSITKDNYGWTTIRWLSRTPNAFPSGGHHSIWQPTTSRCLARRPDAFASGGHHTIWKQWIYSITLVTRIKSIRNKKKKHAEALEILRIACLQLSSLDEPRLRALHVGDSLFTAAKCGIVEIVSELAKINRDFLLTKRDGINILSTAIVHRQEKVFNFLCGIGGLLSEFLFVRDNDGNNILHHTGILPSLSQEGIMAGAAFQMQRELQWFQEVEKLTPSYMMDHDNNRGLKPREFFTEQHTELVKKGEKWMKDTANACMIVAALIVTVTFAAAFTVPGGNDQTLGFPIFLRRNLFLFFITSDALSLFSSSTSVLMFLSIYTSRYAEEDFLKSLPKRLIIGLSTLFFSIATMMVAFCATMFLTLGKHYKWAAILVTFLATIPVILFIWLQFPLFLDMIMSTYGPGLFSRTHGSKTQIELVDPCPKSELVEFWNETFKMGGLHIQSQ